MTLAVVQASYAIPILTYHQIAPKPPKGTPFRSLCVAPSDFAHQMRLLKFLGYQGLSMTQLLPYLTGEKQGKVVGITFDDGYRNNLELALPILQACGFSSTCYVVSQRLGGMNDWDRAIGIPQVPLMTREELQKWIQAGQDVGAHTRNHVHLPQTDAPTRVNEIVQCKRELENQLGQQVQHFCYPYGDFDAEIEQLVRATGYLTATTTIRGRSARGQALHRLPRVPVVRTTSLLVFWWKLVSSYEDRRGVDDL